MTTADPVAVTLRVTAVLEELQIDYVIGGSLASSLYGPYRSTQDSDIVADIPPDQVPVLLDRLLPDFYVSPEAILDALVHNTSFNLIDRATSFKVDVFVPKQRAFERSQIDRGVVRTVGPDAQGRAKFSSAEDILLAKLEWYRLGGETSNQQWNDIRGILRVQGDRLDRDYLSEMAAELGVQDLLARAKADVSRSD